VKPVRLLLVCLPAALLLAGCGPSAEPEPAVQAPPVIVEEAATAVPVAEMATEAPPDAPATAEDTAPSASSPTVYAIDPARSEARYEVGETFFEDNRFNIAVGTTKGISGQVVVDESNPAASHVDSIEVDVSQLVSDRNRRDEFLQDRSLASGQFPTARFVGTAITGMPDNPQRGEPVTFQLSGDLTVRDITLPVTWLVTATLGADMLSGTATTEVLMSAYGIGPIKIMTLGTEDSVKLTLDFVAVPE